MTSYLQRKVRRTIPPAFHHLIHPTECYMITSDVNETVAGIQSGTGGSVQHTSNITVAEGEVTDYTPEDKSTRQPSLWTISYKSSGAMNYTEKITESELETALSLASKRLSSSLLPQTILFSEREKATHYESTISEQHNLGMEIALGHGILWKLILAASLEIEWDSRAREALETVTLEHNAENRKSNGRGTRKLDGSGGVCPKYYRAHPTSYLGGQFPKHPPVTQSSKSKSSKSNVSQNPLNDLEGNVNVAPSALGQRVKAGIQKAYDYCTYHHTALLESHSMGHDDQEVVSSRRSSSRLRDTKSSTPAVYNDDLGKLPTATEQGGTVAIYLLHLLDLFAKNEDVSNDAKDLNQLQQKMIGTAGEVLNVTRDDSDEDKGTDENETKDTDDTDDELNPYFKPKPIEVLQHLMKYQKATSPAEIQTGICYALEDSIPIQQFELNLVEPLKSFNDDNDDDEALLKLRNIGGNRYDTSYRLTLVCTTGDSLKDLPEFEPASFSRCRFKLSTYFQEQEEANVEEEYVEDNNGADAEEREREQQILLQEKLREEALAMEQYRKEEREWRNRKHYETWRHLSIGGGCTIWPSWKTYVAKKLSNQKMLEDAASSEQNSSTLTKETSSNAGIVSSDNTIKEEEQTASSSNDPATTTANSSIVEKGFTSKEQEEKDAALAKSIASVEENISSSTGIATQRRSRRSTAMNADQSTTFSSMNIAGGTTNLIFYGSNQSLSAQQLIDAVHRLIVKSWPSPMSLVELKRLVIDDGSYSNVLYSMADLKKVRMVLGKLLFRMGKVERMLLNTESDAHCLEKVQMTSCGDKSLIMFEENAVVVADFRGLKKEAAPDTDNPDNTDVLMAGTTEEKTDLEEVDKKEESIPKSEEKSIGDNDTDLQHAQEENNIHQDQELQQLQTYIHSLHHIELTIRSLLLRHYSAKSGHSSLQQMISPLLATAADELDKEPDAMDRADFDPQQAEKIEWSTTTSHPLIGEVLFRPIQVNGEEFFPPDYDTLACSWFKIVSHCPSLPLLQSTESVESQMNNGSANNGAVVSNSNNNVQSNDIIKDNTVVKRRSRFRAVKIKSHLDDSEHSEELPEATFIHLTEGQAHAGINAAKVEIDNQKRLSKRKCANDHPFCDMTGMQVLLLKSETEDDQIIHATIAGHENAVSNDGTFEYRVLLLANNDDKKASEDTEEGQNSGFWAKVSPGGNMVSLLDSNASYKVEPQEYHPSSPAYQACEAVLEYANSNVKIVPFQEPVDPDGLGIPEYFDVIKKPMDLSTVEKNLRMGLYGRIAPGGEYHSPVSKMLHGPFWSDLMLVFDNAMTFNPASDWIHQDAVQLKRLLSKKIETLANRAERELDIPLTAKSAKKKSLYVDEDSDVDMYEYESDYDDETSDGANRGKKKRKKSTYRPEDFATRAIEKPMDIPNSFESGFFSVLPIVTDAKKFSLPQDWSCRHASVSTKSDASKAVSNSNELTRKGEERIRQLQMKLQEEESHNIRRSARSSAASRNNEDHASKNTVTSNDIHNVDFFLKNKISTENDDKFLQLAAQNRQQIEAIRERIHEEYFAKLFYKYCSNTSSRTVTMKSIDEDEIGVYKDTTFPPFLGRIVPLGVKDERSQKDVGLIWEIESQYVIPALRWIIRGLIASGHLEGLESPSSENQNDISIVIPNHAYYYNSSKDPFDILDLKEMGRKKRSEIDAEKSEVEEEEEEAEMSAYEKMRAERVARNKERLKLLGLG